MTTLQSNPIKYKKQAVTVNVERERLSPYSIDTGAFLKHHPSLHHHAEWLQLIKPLNELGISYFTYNHFDEQNNRTFLGSDPRVYKPLFRKGLVDEGVHRQIVEGNEHFILHDLASHNGEGLKAYDLVRAFGYGHFFTIILCDGAVRRNYTFGTESGNDAINSSYLMHIQELKHFINYFHDSIKDDGLFDRHQQFMVPSAAPVSNYIDANNHVHNIINDVDGQNSCVSLSAREYDCLEWLARGKTFEEIAMIINLSVRTVRFHLDRIIEKTGCFTLFQLGQLYNQITNNSDNMNNNNKDVLC